MSNFLSDLLWLPRPDCDFSVRCSHLSADTSELGRKIMNMSGYGLDLNQMQRLSRTIQKLKSDPSVSLSPLTPFRLAILGNGTLEFLPSACVATAARHGLDLDIMVGKYDQMLQDAIDARSEVNTFKPQAVLIAIDYRALPWTPTPGNAEAAAYNVKMALDYLQSIRKGILRHSGAICIMQTLAPPVESVFGHYDGRLVGTMVWLVDTLNRHIVESFVSSEDILFDVARLGATVGLQAWHSPQEWNLAKLPFSSLFVPLYADHLCRIIAAMLGRSRRCLILDLDNTLWGGVIGDDGIEGIKIAQGDAVGEAYLTVQKMALDLRARGIILAVSSKNSDEIARQPFRLHPDMLLREEHISVFQANWRDKAVNIKAIAQELSLGLDSMVFLDDNPAERELIRQQLPEVAVPELGDDPAFYATILASAGYFEAVAFSREDRERAQLYQDNSRRVALLQQNSDIESYLSCLNMEICFRPFDATGRSRIVQLINKSNQYNLTTRRYTEADVMHMENTQDIFTLQARLTDKFGDNGMICVVICKTTAINVWLIDTWLMSCRVLGRRVEEAVLNAIVHHARLSGISKLVGEYIPSQRNGIVQKLYEELGFVYVSEEPDGRTIWSLSVDTPFKDPPIRIHHDFD